MDALEAKTDRELLLLTAVTVERLERKADSLNGRVSALERWRWWLVGAGAVVVPLSPLLVYEVRQTVFGGFGG